MYKREAFIHNPIITRAGTVNDEITAVDSGEIGASKAAQNSHVNDNLKAVRGVNYPDTGGPNVRAY